MNKLAGLKTFDDHLKERYGEENSPERKEFEAKAKAWYYAELLKDERKRQNITQKVLAEKIGKKREYISSLEKGQTDMQLVAFLLSNNLMEGCRLVFLIDGANCIRENIEIFFGFRQHTIILDWLHLEKKFNVSIYAWQ